MMDTVIEDATGQDDPLARLKARKAQGTGDPLARLKAKRGGGPITPNHSKFTAEELQSRADQSVEDATRETMDAQGNLIETLQAGAGALELAPLAANAAKLPAAIRAVGSGIRSLPKNLGVVRDIALLSTGSPRALGRLGLRVADYIAEAKGVKPPFPTPAPVASAVEGVSPGGGMLRRAMETGRVSNSIPDARFGTGSSTLRSLVTEAPTTAPSVQESGGMLFRRALEESQAKAKATVPDTDWRLMGRIEQALHRNAGTTGPSAIPRMQAAATARDEQAIKTFFNELRLQPQWQTATDEEVLAQAIRLSKEHVY